MTTKVAWIIDDYKPVGVAFMAREITHSLIDIGQRTVARSQAGSSADEYLKRRGLIQSRRRVN